MATSPDGQRALRSMTPPTPAPPVPASTWTVPSGGVYRTALRIRLVTTRASSGSLAVTVGQPVSLDFQDADLRSVLRALVAQGGLNVVFDDGVQGKEVIAVDDHNHRWPAEQRIRSDDPVHAADCLDGGAWAGIGRGDEHARFHAHPGTVDEGTDSQKFAGWHDEHGR